MKSKRLLLQPEIFLAFSDYTFYFFVFLKYLEEIIFLFSLEDNSVDNLEGKVEKEMDKIEEDMEDKWESEYIELLSFTNSHDDSMASIAADSVERA